MEMLLRGINLRYLRDSSELLNIGGPGSRDMGLFRHDNELGWAPIPNSALTFTGYRKITVRHNSLGLRDVELDPAPKPTIMVLGNSLVWGSDVEADERFTEVLRQRLPDHRIVNAGVTGYGTDQEYLFLRRMWNDIKPNVVILVFSVETDRDDNTSNARYDFRYKPYFVQSSDGSLQVAGQPVPWSRHRYFSDNAIAHHSWLARLAVSLYLHVRYRVISIPDPTERLLDMTRNYVEANGAMFLVGVQYRDPQLEAYLTARKISVRLAR